MYRHDAGVSIVFADIFQEKFFYFSGDLLLTDSNGCPIMRGGRFFIIIFIFFLEFQPSFLLTTDCH